MIADLEGWWIGDGFNERPVRSCNDAVSILM